MHNSLGHIRWRIKHGLTVFLSQYCSFQQHKELMAFNLRGNIVTIRGISKSNREPFQRKGNDYGTSAFTATWWRDYLYLQCTIQKTSTTTAFKQDRKGWKRSELCKEITLLDAIHWIAKAWSETASLTLTKCFKTTGFPVTDEQVND